MHRATHPPPVAGAVTESPFRNERPVKEGPLDQFKESLDRLGVHWVDTTPGDFVPCLREEIDPPVVGSPLPWNALELPDPPVRIRPTMERLERARTGVSAASIGIAEYGSLVLCATSEGDEPVSLFPEHHVAVLDVRTLYPDMTSAVEWLGNRFRKEKTNAVIATGPSATADMGELVYGAHGPREVTVMLVSDL